MSTREEKILELQRLQREEKIAELKRLQRAAKVQELKDLQAQSTPTQSTPPAVQNNALNQQPDTSGLIPGIPPMADVALGAVVPAYGAVKGIKDYFTKAEPLRQEKVVKPSQKIADVVAQPVAENIVNIATGPVYQLVKKALSPGQAGSIKAVEEGLVKMTTDEIINMGTDPLMWIGGIAATAVTDHDILKNTVNAGG